MTAVVVVIGVAAQRKRSATALSPVARTTPSATDTTVSRRCWTSASLIWSHSSTRYSQRMIGFVACAGCTPWSSPPSPGERPADVLECDDPAEAPPVVDHGDGGVGGHDELDSRVQGAVGGHLGRRHVQLQPAERRLAD